MRVFKADCVGGNLKLWLGGGRHLGEDVHHGLVGEVLQVLLVLD